MDTDVFFTAAVTLHVYPNYFIAIRNSTCRWKITNDNSKINK